MNIVKRETNFSSISTARLCSLVVSIANGFAGSSTAKPISLDELLPFPLDEKAFNEDQDTIEVIKELIRRKKLPVRVISALTKVISIG